MNKTSIAIFTGSLLMAIGGWVKMLTAWSMATTPGSIAALLLAIGGLIVNWLNASPFKSSPITPYFTKENPDKQNHD